MAERFIGTNEFGELLFYDDQFGTTRTQPPVDAQGQTIGRGGIFGDITPRRRDLPMLGFIERGRNIDRQLGFPNSLGFDQSVSNLFNFSTPNNNFLGPNLTQQDTFFTEGPFGAGLGVVQSVDPLAPNYSEPVNNPFNIDFGGTGETIRIPYLNFMPSISGIGGPGFLSDIDVTSDIGRRIDDITRIGANRRSSSGDANADALNYATNFKLRNERGPDGNLVTGQTVLYRDTEDFTGGPNSYRTNNEMLLLAQNEGYKSIEDFIKTQDKRFVRVDVTSPNPVGSGVREGIEKQEIVLSNGTTRLETDAEAIVRINRENEEKIKKEDEELNLAKRRQGIGLVNKFLNIFGTPSGVETYMVDGQEVTYTPGDKATDAADIALLKEKGIIQDEEEVDSTPLMTAEQGKELLKLYIMGAGLLNQQQKTTSMDVAPMYAQKGLNLKVDDPYKKRRI